MIQLDCKPVCLNIQHEEAGPTCQEAQLCSHTETDDSAMVEYLIPNMGFSLFVACTNTPKTPPTSGDILSKMELILTTIGSF